MPEARLSRTRAVYPPEWTLDTTSFQMGVATGMMLVAILVIIIGSVL